MCENAVILNLQNMSRTTAYYKPISTVLAVTGVCEGALACLTLISQVSNSWDTEKRRGSFVIRAFNAF